MSRLAQVLPEVQELLINHLRATTPDDLADGLRRRTWSSNRPEPLPPLAQATAIRTLSADTKVRLRSGLHHQLVAGDPLTLRLPGRVITFPTMVSAALIQLLDGQEHKPGTLPGLPLDDQLVLIRRLLTEAVLVALP